MAFADTKHGKFFYFEPDDIGRRIAAGEFFDAHLRPYIEALGAGSVFVDVGANIGFFTVYAALYRGATVHAFEPSPAVFGLLAKNVDVNGIRGKVQLHQVALYDRETELMVNPEWQRVLPDYEHCGNSGGLSLIRRDVPEGLVFAAKPLDSFALDSVALIKTDTQGADLRVLVGARKTIEYLRPIVCFEFEHNGCGCNASGDTLGDFMKYFAELNYDVKPIGGNGGTWTDFAALPQ